MKVTAVKAHHTTTEVARMLGVSRQTVLRMVHAGRIRTNQTPGGFHRIPADEVNRLLEERGLIEQPRNGRVSLLIVDNELDVIELLRRALKPAGDRIDVRTASSGIDALLEIGRSVPNILILDLCMPGMDGYAVCREIRQRYYDNIKIIAISGENSLTPQEREEHGMDAFFAKPVPLVEVLELIGRWA
jgi:putative two-component system response regulator